MNKIALFFTCFIIGTLYSGLTQACSLSTSAHIGVDAAVTLIKNSDIQFGTVKAGVASVYTISTEGKVSSSHPGAWLSGTPAAGSVTIAGSGTEPVNISIGGYSASNGVTLRNATCAYNGRPPGACAISGATAPGTGKKLLIGVSAIVNGAQAAHTNATPGFSVTVVYP
jgi:hypothetical protein